MRILLTNDDGVHAEGIHALAKALSSLGEVFVAAPDRERSAAGHSITVYEPIKVMKTEVPGTAGAWGIGGTPVDCVKLAVSRLVGDPVDLVVSGINYGPNLGKDVLYSGTVSAAAEGTILGIPAIAVSLNVWDEKANFEFAALFARQLIRSSVRNGMTHSTLLNVNIPNLSREQVKGIRITKLGNRNYKNLFEERKDPRGNTYYWMGGGIKKEIQDEESDVLAVEQGFISITPVHLDLTDYHLMEEYRKQGYHLETILL